MASLPGVRSWLVDAPDSLGGRRRSRRWERLHAQFREIELMSVVDLGGTPESWLRAPIRPACVLIVNLEPQPSGLPSWLRAIQADACNLPASVASSKYDLVFSNSVIEHVGGHTQRMRFADAVHSVADRHWVQTPYRYFPIEPHWLFPGFQFLPVAVRAEISRIWPLTHASSSSRLDAIRGAMSVELLSRTEMSFYFDHSSILVERFSGTVKSLIAVKQA